MTLESQLIKKEYYQMYINEQESVQPIRVLGEAYQEELQKDLPDLTSIRFAQGEIYFHNRDYEAAIFKWENITGELELWARKNIADAYYESGLLSNAEDLYLSIETHNLTLKTEVSLQLFSLYIDREKREEAVEIIKKTINSNPDYPNVTDIARAYFEDQQDWANAIELAVNEAKRTGSTDWYDTVNSYVKKGLTKSLNPNYFTQAIFELYSLDQRMFEELTTSLWRSYQDKESYFTWLKEVNHLLLNLDLSRNLHFEFLSELHYQTYFGLINGNFIMKTLEDLVPDLLTNWLRLSVPKHTVLVSAAVLSWNELFPTSISMSIVSEAENLISETNSNIDELEESLNLFEAIISWAKTKDMGENNHLKWVVQQLNDFDTHHLFITGLSGSGKSAFVNSILGEEIQDSPTSSLVMFKDFEELNIYEITDHETIKLADFTHFQERMDRRRNALESIIEFQQPFPFLYEQKLTLIETPGLKGSHQDRYEVLQYIQLADTLLFVIDANAPFTEKEKVILSQINELAPDIPIHFLLSKMDTIVNEQEAIKIYDEAKSKIQTYLPEAEVFAYSSQYERGQQLLELKGFMQSITDTRNIADKRLAKLLFFIRTTISRLLQKRIDVENQLIESVRWNEEVVMKLNGALNQLKDTEAQKIKAITRSYRTIKESIQNEISIEVPKILQECSELIAEDSNISTIHIELNDVMNKRLQDYLEQEVMPKYYTSLQEWINSSKEEFAQGQEFLDEMAEGLNSLYGEERIKPLCDFKVLDDWHRDTDRMTSRFQLEKVNILLRNTPSQFLLKSAGKLFGALSQNKSLLYNKYKDFVKNDSYSEPTEVVIERFFQQFELFEKSLERDITLFFRQPLKILNEAIEESLSQISANQDILKKMNTNPEMFRDPLTLFEVRLRQFEWATLAGKGVHTIY
ncbi:dynamin family protein [Neobacillus niacini]|uniref:dynamin family protein n=1 Tax=Neobacillus niacini TaxID=86668 RepID=UPI00052FC152|nr:dynamin family protein [Neobacillus niacini]KGM44637.1 GTP-binding protein [Neobacillus niacini]MEC1522345.1 dynamin family protein [Neobacillus niacini]